MEKAIKNSKLNKKGMWLITGSAVTFMGALLYGLSKCFVIVRLK